jgi:hypothetical protein
MELAAMATTRKTVATTPKAEVAVPTGLIPTSPEDRVKDIRTRLQSATETENPANTTENLTALVEESARLYYDMDKAVAVGGMVRTVAAAYVVRGCQALDPNMKSGEIAGKLPTADGKVVGASSVTRWKQLATLIFDRGFDPLSQEFRLLARGAANHKEVKAVIDSGADRDDIITALNTWVRPDGVKLTKRQVAAIEAVRSDPEKTDADAEKVRDGFRQESEPSATTTARPEQGKVTTLPTDTGKILDQIETLIARLKMPLTDEAIERVNDIGSRLAYLVTGEEESEESEESASEEE